MRWSKATVSAHPVTSPMADEFLDGFMDDYFVECEEHLTTIRRLLLTLEEGVGRQAAPPAVLDELFRSFHSIKGISGMVELRDAEMLAHHMESYLRALRQREAQLTAAGMDALIRGVDALEQTIAARRERAAAPSIDLMVRQLAAVVPQAGAGVAPQTDETPAVATASWRVTFVPSPDAPRARRQRGQRPRAAARRGHDRRRHAEGHVGGDRVRVPARGRAGRGEPGRVGGRRHARRAGAPWSIPPSAERAERPTAARASPRRMSSASISARLDEVMRMIGDLVISRARLDRRAGAGGGCACRPRSGARSRRTPRRSSVSCAICAKG